MPAKKARPVIVFTTYKGVFFGYATDTTGDIIHLKECRMAIYWGTTRGVMELAHSGPTATSKISAKADMELRGITGIAEVTAEAEKKWSAIV